MVEKSIPDLSMKNNVDDEMKVMEKPMKPEFMNDSKPPIPSTSNAMQPPNVSMPTLDGPFPSEGFKQFFNDSDFASVLTTNNAERFKRKNLRRTANELTSGAAIDAQKLEQERLNRLKRPAGISIESYMPVMKQEVIELGDTSSSDDDAPECLGVFKSELRQSPHSVLPSKVGRYNPDFSRSSDKRPNQAQQEEEHRLRRQKAKREEDLESVEKNAQGRLLVNFDRPEGEPEVFVADHLTDVLKPHQLGGIRFLYDNIIETVRGYRKDRGFGCVLAHSMGLGKTLQIVEFVDIFLRTVDAKHVLIITPVNVIQNWGVEFDKWLPTNDGTGRNLRPFPVFLLGDSVKSFEDRRDLILKWKNDGGVMLMGYDMFRIFFQKTLNPNYNPVQPSKKMIQPSMFNDDILSEDLLKLKMALLDPGPDLVICDEGHKIKSLKTSISNALNQIRTRRRIVLTGYPLQNNLIEYYCMVNFVRPNYLGTKGEFSSVYDRPIRNGQCVDSTVSDIRRAQVTILKLIKSLKGFVQRRSALLLKKILPENQEFVIVVRKTPIQQQLYRAFMIFANLEAHSRNSSTFNPLKAHAIGTKIWNHPDLLYLAYLRKMDDYPKNPNSTNGSVFDAVERLRLLRTAPDDYMQIVQPMNGQKSDEFAEDDLDQLAELTYEWAGPVLKDYTPMVLENSNKMIVAMDIIRETVALGEKILLFSASIVTLNLYERFLKQSNALKMVNFNNEEIVWSKNVTYCRFDGSTPAVEREKIIHRFNSDPNIHLFLISTKAGSLGINLVSANRVIIMDASWNPCHDAQAVCRVYRYGQQKKTFIYRLIMYNSIEQKIFYRQISKSGLSKKVVDKMDIAAKVTTDQLENLLKYEERLDMIVGNPDLSDWTFDDGVLNSLVKTYPNLIAEKPFLHDSMLTESESYLSEQEKFEVELWWEREQEAIKNRNLMANNVDDVRFPSLNRGLKPDYVNRELNYQNGVFRGSLSDLRRSEHSDIGLNRTQFQVASLSTMHQAASFPNMDRQLMHPLHGSSGGTLYKMNNTTVTKGMEPQPIPSTIRLIEEDIWLPDSRQQMHRIQQGEEVRIMVMSGKTYVKRVKGNDQPILDATGTKYDPRTQPPPLIQLD